MARLFPGYENRPAQLVMAQEVARALRDDDFALVEAGTGTGKTLAYLLPALLSGRKTIVSTGLKNLQDQIFDHDLPFIRRVFGDGFRAARLKGRENYLCLYFLKKALAQKSLFPTKQQKEFQLLANTYPKVETGDRGEFPLPDDWPHWSEVSVPAERCLGNRCPDFNECFLVKARRQAAAADLVLVNHHLFMADLALKANGFGEVLPEWDALVFDEAHLLEEAATNYFGRSLSTRALSFLLKDLEQNAMRLTLTTWAKTEPLLKTFQAFNQQLLSFYRTGGEFELWQEGDKEAAPLASLLMDFHEHSLIIADTLKGAALEDDELAPVRGRLLEAASTMLFLAENSRRDYVYQGERQGQRLTLAAFPIRVSKQLADNLLSLGRPIVFTSATLSNGGDFKFFKERMGLLAEVEGITLDSPFDYAKRTLTYVPKNFPEPQDPNFLSALGESVAELLKFSDGRALVLCTSHRSLNYLAQNLKNSPWPILVQGEMSRSALLAEFRQNTHSVLLATQSFWQGVDVPGESLINVIIEKLPFPNPSRPLVNARSRLLTEEGRNSFRDYYLPEAALTLKQGLGRLLRSKNDRGLLAILDVRLLTKSYGKLLLKGMPPSPLTSDLAEVAEFFKRTIT